MKLSTAAAASHSPALSSGRTMLQQQDARDDDPEILRAKKILEWQCWAEAFQTELGEQLDRNELNPNFLLKLQHFLEDSSLSPPFDIVPEDTEEHKKMKSRVYAEGTTLFKAMDESYSRDKLQSNQTARSLVKNNDQLAEKEKSLGATDGPSLSRPSNGTRTANPSAKQADFKAVGSDEARSNDKDSVSDDGVSGYG